MARGSVSRHGPSWRYHFTVRHGRGKLAQLEHFTKGGFTTEQLARDAMEERMVALESQGFRPPRPRKSPRPESLARFAVTGPHVYVLWAGEEVLYVGKSSNVFGRIGSHLNAREKREATTHISWLPCESVKEMDTYEKFYIATLKPRLNIEHTPGGRVQRQRLISFARAKRQSRSEVF